MYLQALSGSVVTLVAFLLMLGLLVLVHELGHFWTARRLGIKVEEFGIGFPPRAKVLFERDGVLYTLNWLPIGGFVRFGGEGETVYGVGSLAQAAPWKKISVLLAGPLMNLFLAMLIFAVLFSLNGTPSATGVQIGKVFPNTPAAAAGLQNGDKLIELNGQQVQSGSQMISEIATQNAGRPVAVTVQRNGQPVTLQITPGPWTTTAGEHIPVGFGFQYSALMEPVSLPRAVVLGVTHTWNVLGQFIDGLRQLFGGLLGVNPPPPGGVTGIVGIARGTGEVIQQDGMQGFWQWTALISLNLFLVNLLPIPALDGSHILFSLIEVLRRGKKVPPEKEAMVHAVGFVMLMGLMVIITISDISHWISGAPVFGGG
jgi:regulator of sigma E protease